MKFRAWALAIMLWLPQSYGQEVAVVVSEVWPDATEENGQGFYWDLIRQAFASQHIQLVTDSMPYQRGVYQVQNWQADAWVGAYLNEVENIEYSQQAIDQDQVVVIAAPATVIDLKHGQFSWMRGYQFDRYLPIAKPGYLVNDRQQAIDMLLRGHGLTGHIDVEAIVVPLQQQGDIQLQGLEMKPLAVLPLHLGFQFSPRGRRLRDAFDRGMQMLKANGKLRQLQRQYGWPETD